MSRIQEALQQGGRFPSNPRGPPPPLKTLTHREKLNKDYDFYKETFYVQRQRNFKEQEEQIQIMEETLRQMSEEKEAAEGS